jgi:hypothetical protein
MPTPQPDETRDDFVSRCIPIVIEDGTAEDGSQANAICNSMWEDAHKNMDDIKAVTKSEQDGNHPASHYLVVEDPKKPSTWHLRVKDASGNADHRLMGAAWAALHGGYRGNKYEGPGKQEAITKLIALYKREKMEVPSSKELSMDTLIAWGGPVKALGGGKIGGYLIRFSTDKDPDLEQEFFTKETDYGDADSAPVYYQHGMDAKIGKRRLGKAKHKMDEFGIWAEAQLSLRDEYEKFIYRMAEEGKMGWSSGTAGHLIERESYGKATWIKSWPLGLDDTLTPVPAEPRNTAMPLKSWQPEEWEDSDLPGLTLADRMSNSTEELKSLFSDLRGLIDGIDKPLSETKRKELTDLLGMFPELDAVRSDIQNVLNTAPTAQRLVDQKLIRHQLAEAQKRIERRTFITGE